MKETRKKLSAYRHNSKINVKSMTVPSLKVVLLKHLEIRLLYILYQLQSSSSLSLLLPYLTQSELKKGFRLY